MARQRSLRVGDERLKHWGFTCALLCTVAPAAAVEVPDAAALPMDVEFLEYLGLEADAQWDEFFDDMAPDIAGQPPEPLKAPEDDDDDE